MWRAKPKVCCHLDVNDRQYSTGGLGTVEPLSTTLLFLSLVFLFSLYASHFPKDKGRVLFQPRGQHFCRKFLLLSRCSGPIDTWQSFACALGPRAKCREGWAEGGVTWFQSEISEIWPCFDEAWFAVVVLIQCCGPLFFVSTFLQNSTDSSQAVVNLNTVHTQNKLYLHLKNAILHIHNMRTIKISFTKEKRIKIQRNSF